MTLDNCKLVSLNVRGISNFCKRRTIYTWCRKQKADFIFLQETHSKHDTEKQWKNEWGGKNIMSHGSANSRSVAILFKKGVDCIIHSKILDPVGRYVILKAEIKDKMYLLINIYAPNKDTNIVEFLKDLGTTLQKENLDEEENIILGGDFNCPLNPVLDKKGGILLPRKSVVATIDCLCADLDLVDIWRVKNPSTKSYTWSQNSPMILCRLDYWLISNNLQDLVTTTDIIPAIKTDHAAISIEFSISEKHIKGPGHWKMNCSLLDDEDYVRELTVKIPIWQIEGQHELTDNRSIWDWTKYKIRAHAIQHSKRKVVERKEKEMNLQNEFAKAKQLFDSDPNTNNANALNSVKEKLELLYEEKLQGIIIRARARWWEHGERSTKYFLNLEKRNHVKKHVRKLRTSGSIITDPFNILSKQNVNVNVDAKIMSKVLATRIKNVLPDIIHHNQSGFVKDRYIGETVRSIFDLMDFTLKENIPGLMIFIDFHKAFDSVEWNYLVTCLEAFCFGPDFIRWVKTLYKNIQSCVINNGLTTDYFALERGVRQGDPLSPYLFVVVVETLAIAIRQNTAIKDISIGKEETKLLQYADDTTAVLSDRDSAHALFNLLDVFRKLSGLKINSS